MTAPLRFAALSFIVLCAVIRVAAADDKEKPPELNLAWLAEHYTKYEHRIPMRDGVRLFTRVFVPKDDSSRWPFMLTRTPYALKPSQLRNAHFS